MSDKYLANRLKYHTASRVGAKETDPLLNALNRDQHTVSDKMIWTSLISDFPLNTGSAKTTVNSTDATRNLIEVFKTTGTVTSEPFRNGHIYKNKAYPAVTLYENVDMHPVEFSNGSGNFYESYEVLDANNIRLQDWVSPLAVFDPELNKPVPGYAGMLMVRLKNTNAYVEVQNTERATDPSVSGSVWAAAYGNWEFVYSAGIATFNAAYTPTRYADQFETDENGIVKLRWTGFLYTGIYLDTTLKNTFAGITLPDTTNLDAYCTTGIARITNNVTGSKPGITDVSGFIQVMDINHDEDTTEMKNYRRVRQIIYPDNRNESAPYTRVGSVDSLSGTITWSDWAQLGGGALRRAVVDGTVTTKTYGPETNPPIQNDVLYESYGNNIFILPDPNNTPVATRIGIEQHVGSNGRVKLSSDSNTETILSSTILYVLTTDSTFEADKQYYIYNDGVYVEASVAVGAPIPEKTYYVKTETPTSYIFECILKNTEPETREWVLDLEHNHGPIFDTINDRIRRLEDDVASAAIISNYGYERIGVVFDNLGIRSIAHHVLNGETLSLTFVQTLPDVSSANPVANMNERINALSGDKMNLNYYNMVVTASENGTIYLPASVTSIKGVSVVVDIANNVSVTVVVGDGSVSETFTAVVGETISNSSQWLHLEFVFADYEWKLVTMA